MVKQITLISVLLLTLCSCSTPQSSPTQTTPNTAADLKDQQQVDNSVENRSAAATVNAPSAVLQQKPLVVEFYSTICAECKQLQPTIDKIVSDYKDRVDFKAYDAAGIPNDVKRRYQFIGYPQIVILHSDGQIAFNRLGFQTYDSLSSDLNAVLNSPTPLPIDKP